MATVQRWFAYASVWLVIAGLVPQALGDVAYAQAVVSSSEQESRDLPTSHAELHAADRVVPVASPERSTTWSAVAPRVDASAACMGWAADTQPPFEPWTPDRRHGIRRVRGGLLLPSSEDAADAVR